MKSLLIFIYFFSISLFSQTYVLDQTFGNNGALQLGEYVRVNEGFALNNSAYFITSNGKLLKINIDGTNLTEHHFDYLFNAKNYKLINNSIFIYGFIAPSITNYNFFIGKMDLDGNPDLNFGTNGMKIIDFGQMESMSDIALTANGELLCSGVRYPSVEIDSSLIVFKIDAVTGDLISSFDPNGYKIFTSNLSGNGNNPFRGGFLISQSSNYYLFGNNFQGSTCNITLIKMDANGVVDTTYGINGYKSVPTSHYGSVNRFSFLDNKLYALYSYPQGSLGTNSNLFCYDIISDQTIFDFTPSFSNYTNSFYLYDNSIYNTYRNLSYNSTDKFYVEKRFLNNALVDSSFHINGLYSYNSTSLSTYNFQDEANIIVKLGNDFLIAGYSRYTYAISPLSLEYVYEGSVLIKITPGVLDVNNNMSNNTSIDLFPNPFQNEIHYQSSQSIEKIEVYDLLGRKIFESELNNTNGFINVEQITQKGTYLIKFNASDGGTIVQKIVKN